MSNEKTNDKQNEESVNKKAANVKPSKEAVNPQRNIEEQAKKGEAIPTEMGTKVQQQGHEGNE